MTPSDEHVERWARALTKVWGSDPDELIGNPPNPRWMSFTSYARMAIEAKALLGDQA